MRSVCHAAELFSLSVDLIIITVIIKWWLNTILRTWVRTNELHILQMNSFSTAWQCFSDYELVISCCSCQSWDEKVRQEKKKKAQIQSSCLAWSNIIFITSLWDLIIARWLSIISSYSGICLNQQKVIGTCFRCCKGAPFSFVESQSNRISWTGRDPQRSWSPSQCVSQCFLNVAMWEVWNGFILFGLAVKNCWTTQCVSWFQLYHWK